MKKISSVIDFIVDLWVEAVDLFIDFISYVIVPLLLVFIVLSLFLGILGVF